MPKEVPEQTFKSHARVVPPFHYFVLPVLAFNVIWTVVGLVRHPSGDAALAALVALSILMVALFARIFALRVQDRVIRLEMRLRMREVCPPDLAARAGEFSPAQLIALRFASDAELTALARKVLDEKLQNRKAIKLMVKNWQADDLRV